MRSGLLLLKRAVFLYIGGMGKREIVLADTLGFCFGVRRALDKVELAIEQAESEGGRVLTFGPLIHNASVMRDLASRGVGIADTLDDLREGDIVVVRAHGVPRNVKEEMNRRGIALIDGTCPRVLRSEKMAEKSAELGSHLVISGDTAHGEVEAVSSYAGRVDVISKPEDAEHVVLEAPIFLLSQTTYSRESFKTIEEILERRCESAGLSFRKIDTICPATGERQFALGKLCAEVEAVVVIGGRNSANTRRLYERAQKLSERAWHIEESDEVNDEMRSFQRIGVTAGASTPDTVIQEVVNRLKEG